MNRKRILRTCVLAAAALGVAALTTGQAGAATPVALVDPTFGGASVATAYNLSASGLVDIPPTQTLVCTKPQERTTADLPTIDLSPLALVKGLHDECNIAPRTTLAAAKAKIASVNLLNGAIKITGIVSKCTITKEGVATCGSTVAQLNGKDVNVGPLSIVIPGVAAVYLDRNTESVVNGHKVLTTTAVEVDVAPIVVAGHVISAGQNIVVGRAILVSAGQTDAP